MSNDAGLGGRLGLEPRPDHARLRPAPGLVEAGRLRAGVLLWLADWEACREAVAANPEVLVATRDLRLRVLRPVTVDEGTTVVARAATVRRSSRNVVVEVQITVEGDEALWAFASGSYAAGRWEGDPARNPQITMSDPAVLAARPPILEPLAQLLGAEPVPGRPGAVRLPPDPQLQNPQGGLSGPVVGLALEAAMAAAAGPGSALADLDVNFLVAGRHGPFVATAELIGPGVLRAELHDEGAQQLLATGLGLLA